MSYDNAYLRSLETAVMLNEAFLTNAHVDIRVFAHTTEGLQSCIVTDYGSKQEAKNTLDFYQPAVANFDFLAIESIVDRFANEREAKKILVSISDGLPCQPFTGLYRDTIDPIAATKGVVEKARKRSWTVMGVEIGNNGGEKIYGDWNMRIQSGSKLPSQLASLAAKLLRRALS